MSASKATPKLKEGLSEKDDNMVVTVEHSASRPPRVAAQRAQKQVLAWITDSDCTDNNIINVKTCYTVVRQSLKRPFKLTLGQLGGV